MIFELSGPVMLALNDLNIHLLRKEHLENNGDKTFTQWFTKNHSLRGALSCLEGFEQMLEYVHGEEIDSTVDGRTHKRLRFLHIVQHLTQRVAIVTIIITIINITIISFI